VNLVAFGAAKGGKQAILAGWQNSIRQVELIL
jgi:hypothetical protein